MPNPTPQKIAFRPEKKILDIILSNLDWPCYQVEIIPNIKMNRGNFFLYPIAQLPELLRYDQDPKNACTYKKYPIMQGSGESALRYIVDINGRIWLAPVGKPGIGIPSFFEMVTASYRDLHEVPGYNYTCLGAGLLRINAFGLVTSIITTRNMRTLGPLILLLLQCSSILSPHIALGAKVNSLTPQYYSLNHANYQMLYSTLQNHQNKYYYQVEQPANKMLHFRNNNVALSRYPVVRFTPIAPAVHARQVARRLACLRATVAACSATTTHSMIAEDDPFTTQAVLAPPPKYGPLKQPGLTRSYRALASQGTVVEHRRHIP